MSKNLISLDMFGHIDDVLTSGVANRTSNSGGSYVNGRYVSGSDTIAPHTVNIQPLTMKQIDNIVSGGERVEDFRQVWVNDGLLASIREADTWSLPDIVGTFKTTRLDNRPTRNYCKFIAVRIDQ